MTTTIKPNLDHKVTVLLTEPSHSLRITSFDHKPNDIILLGTLPLIELQIDISVQNGKLVLTNNGQLTPTLVETVASSKNPPIPVPILTEFRPRMTLALTPYVDFTLRYFTFPVFVHNALLQPVQRLVNLAIYSTTTGKELFINWKILNTSQ